MEGVLCKTCVLVLSFSLPPDVYLALALGGLSGGKETPPSLYPIQPGTPIPEACSTAGSQTPPPSLELPQPPALFTRTRKVFVTQALSLRLSC